MADPRASSVPSAEMPDFVVGVVRVAFLVRLVSLLFVLLVPVSDLVRGRVIVAVLLIALSSIAGFYGHRHVVRVARRHPMLVVVDVLLAAGITALVGADSPLIFYTLSTALLVGVLLPPVHAGLLTLVLVLSQTLAVIETASAARQTLFYVLVLPATCVLVVLLGSMARILHEQVLAQRDRVAELMAESAKHEERARLARDMHDSVAKSLHGIGLAAAALPAWLERSPQAGKTRAAEIREAAEIATKEARALLVRLRDDDTTGRPLNELLDECVTRFTKRYGVPVRFDAGDVVDVPAAVRRELIRIVGEALENVGRHSGAAEAAVECRTAGPDLIVEISDDGCGFDVAGGNAKAGHYGLPGMAERAAAAGGRLELRSTVGAGSIVRVEIPGCDVSTGVREERAGL